MTNLIAVQRQASMRACLEAAISIYAKLSESRKTLDEDLAAIEISVTDLREILTTNFPGLTITDAHLDEVTDRILYNIERYSGLTSCGCFSFAHMLDHVFDLDEMILAEGEVQH